MHLDETIGLMCSDDYKDRLKAEYLQLGIRLRNLMCHWHELDNNDRTTPEGSHLFEQMEAMRAYKTALGKRLCDVKLIPSALDSVIEEE